MLSIWYDDPDAGPVDITGSVKYGIGEIKLQTKAEQGAVATSSIVVQDPDGIYNFRGLRRIWVEESDADFPRIYTGWIWGKTYTRGDYYRTGAARQVTLELQDLNHLLWQKIMAGSDTARPSETDVARIQWLMGTNEAGIVIDDGTTWVSTAGPVTMDANPSPGYNGQTFQNVVDDAAQDSGKNYFMLDEFDGYDYLAAFWYGADGLDAFVSDATISNIESEVDNVMVFWADVGAELDVDPSRVFSGIFGNFDGGWTYQVNATTEDDFANRDTTASWPNVKTQAKAAARAQRQLSQINFEEEAVTVTIYSMLPSQVNVFRAGMRVNGVKFTHFPGWEDGRDVRIVTKTITDQAEGLYSVELELLPLIGALTCSTSIGSAGETANLDIGGTFGPVSIPVSAALFADAQQIMVWVYSGPSQGLGGCSPLTVGGGWTRLDHYDTLGSNTWLAVGNLYQPTIATPPNMTVSATCSGGGFAEAFGVGVAFRTSSSTPVQQAPIELTGSATLPSTPTPGNILFVWAVGETGALDASTFVADGGVMIVENDHTDNGTPGGVYISIGMRCVRAGDTTTVRIPGNSYSHWAGVTEWAP